jgi:hypothetical protein
MTELSLIPTGGARCRQPDAEAEMWFPRPGAIDASTAAAAKRICNGWPSEDPCPLRDACREYGIRNGVSGIWGGLSEDERKAERRRRGIVAQPVSTGAAYPVRTAS